MDPHVIGRQHWWAIHRHCHTFIRSSTSQKPQNETQIQGWNDGQTYKRNHWRSCSWWCLQVGCLQVWESKYIPDWFVSLDNYYLLLFLLVKCTTWDVLNPGHNGMNYPSAGFLMVFSAINSKGFVKPLDPHDSWLRNARETNARVSPTNVWIKKKNPTNWVDWIGTSGWPSKNNAISKSSNLIMENPYHFGGPPLFFFKHPSMHVKMCPLKQLSRLSLHKILIEW